MPKKKKKTFAKVNQMDGTPGQVGTLPDDLVGEPNECPVMVNGISTLRLLNSGSMVSGIACDPSKTVAVSKWPVPANVKDLQRFLGFTGFYCRFIQDYAKVTRPLTELLRSRRGRNWSTTSGRGVKLKTMLLKHWCTH